MAAAKAQIVEKNLLYDLYSVPFVKPINQKQLKAIVEKHPDGLITLEEHQLSCGMGSAIVEQVNDLFSKGKISTYPKIQRIAIPDEFAPIVGTQNYLREYEGLKL
jgi:transketolase